MTIPAEAGIQKTPKGKLDTDFRRYGKFDKLTLLHLPIEYESSETSLSLTCISGYTDSMPTDMPGLIKVSRAGGKQAAETLARAFCDYPLLKYYYPDAAKREKIGYFFVASGVYAGISRGEVYTTSVNMEGIAVWILSDHYSMTLPNMIRSVPFPVILGLLRNGFQRMKDVGDYLDRTHERLAPYKHMYLQIIGVDPRHQGKDYAGKLIRPMLARLDKEKIPCYLETLDETNVSLYGHFGFKLIEKSAIPGTPLTNRAMLRKPGK